MSTQELYQRLDDTFKLVCRSVNLRHSKFMLFDPHGANCGQITILTEDAERFIGSWIGKVDWNGLKPRIVSQRK